MQFHNSFSLKPSLREWSQDSFRNSYLLNIALSLLFFEKALAFTLAHKEQFQKLNHNKIKWKQTKNAKTNLK